MKRLRLCLLGMCFGLLVTPVMALPIFAITLPTNVVHLNPARSGTLTLTAKNVSGITLKNLSVPQTRFLTSVFSATETSNTCDNTTLTNNQSCTVTLNISGVADGSANLSPNVCAFSGLACSHGNVRIKVDNIQQSAPVTSLAANLPDNVQVGTAYPIVATFLNPDTQNAMTGVSITNPPVNSVQTANTCQSGVLAPLASCQVSYLFTAPSSGTYHLNGTFNYNEGKPIINSGTVLAGESAIAGSIVVGLPANVEKDKTYPVIFRYTNFGTAGVTYNTIPAPIPTLGTFTPQAGLTHPCSGGTLAKGGYCDVSGTYTAGAIGSVMLSSTLTATGPGTINPVPLATSSTASDVAITGTVFPTLPTAITPGVSYPVVFTFTNTNPVLPAEKVSIDKLLPSPNFTETSDTCGATLAAGASCAIGGDFQTSVEGPVALTVLFDHDDNASVPLTTSSEATAATLVGTVNGFRANVDKDTAHTVTFTFSNHGSKAAVVNNTTLSFPNIDGTPTDNCNGQTIAPGGSCTITGTFKNAPLGATTWSATVNYNGGIGGSPIDMVQITNTTVGDTIVTGNAITPLPATSETHQPHAFQFTFTNNASSSTAASGLQFVTAMPHVTGLSNSCSGTSTLAPGGTCVISGTFNSAHSGPQTLSATLLYNQGAPVNIVSNTTVFENNEVKCWGYNNSGQLGDNSTTTRTTPVFVQNSSDPNDHLTNVISLATAAKDTCALLQNGTVKCWGYGSSGQLGNGGTSNSLLPVSVHTSASDPSALSGVKEVVGGQYHLCALLQTGEVKCWGYNNSGQLGDNSTTTRTTPVFVQNSSDPNDHLTNVISLATAAKDTCALLQNGTVKCWGYGGSGQLGNGGTSNSLLPVSVHTSASDPSALSGVKEVVGGQYHLCALLQTGEVKCWGYNNSGQLGDNSTTTRTTPVFVQNSSDPNDHLTNVISLATAAKDTCALLQNGTVKCWGYGGSGQLGNGGTSNSLLPVSVHTSASDPSALSGVKEVVGGQYHLCALLQTGEVKCWGYNNSGQLGDNSTTTRTTPVFVYRDSAANTRLINSILLSSEASSGSTCTIIKLGSS